MVLSRGAATAWTTGGSYAMWEVAAWPATITTTGWLAATPGGAQHTTSPSLQDEGTQGLAPMVTAPVGCPKFVPCTVTCTPPLGGSDRGNTVVMVGAKYLQRASSRVVIRPAVMVTLMPVPTPGGTTHLHNTHPHTTKS